MGTYKSMKNIWNIFWFLIMLMILKGVAICCVSSGLNRHWDESGATHRNRGEMAENMFHGPSRGLVKSSHLFFKRL